MTPDLKAPGAGIVSPPRIEAIWFGNGIYERMAKVFLATATAHCPNWRVNLRRVDRVHLERHRFANDSHADNTQKMEQWNATVQNSRDGDRILLVDADTFFVNPIDDIWGREFDIAYTVKQAKFPFNSGVMFVRVTETTKAFFSDWAEENRRMLASSGAHAPWRRKYGGINQAAFGKMLKSPSAKSMSILAIPCREWNCEDSSWAAFDRDTTRIIHVKGALRRALFERRYTDLRRPGIAALVALWEEMESGSD